MLCYCALRDREKLKTGFKRLLTIDVPGEEDERYMVTDVSVTHTCTLALYKSKRLQWNFSIEDTTGTQLAVLYTVEPLYRGHHWDPAGCPVSRGVPNSEADLYTALCGWDCRQCPH